MHKLQLHHDGIGKEVTTRFTWTWILDKFRSYLDSLGLSFNEGKIIDATFVEAPRQHNTHEENRQIKEGNGKNLWQAEAGDSEKEKKRKACPKTLSAFGHVSNWFMLWYTSAMEN